MSRGLTVKSLVVAMIGLGLVAQGGAVETARKSEPLVGKSEVNVSGEVHVVFSKDVLSVSLEDAELEEVLKEISKKSNITISTHGRLREKVTLQFANLPLEEGLKRLLKNQSYSFIYAPHPESGEKEGPYVLSRVVLLEKAHSSGSRQLHTVSEESDPPPQKEDVASSDAVIDEINKLFSQAPKVQEDTLEHLSEIISGNVEELNTKLMEALERASREGESDFGAEKLKELLKEGEIGKTKPEILDYREE